MLKEEINSQQLTFISKLKNKMMLKCVCLFLIYILVVDVIPVSAGEYLRGIGWQNGRRLSDVVEYLLKLIQKEDIIPSTADKFLFKYANSFNLPLIVSS